VCLYLAQSSCSVPFAEVIESSIYLYRAVLNAYPQWIQAIIDFVSWALGQGVQQAKTLVDAAFQVLTASVAWFGISLQGAFSATLSSPYAIGVYRFSESRSCPRCCLLGLVAAHSSSACVSRLRSRNFHPPCDHESGKWDGRLVHLFEPASS